MNKHSRWMYGSPRGANYVRLLRDFKYVNECRLQLGKDELTKDEYRLGTLCQLCGGEKKGATFCGKCWKAHVAINQSIRNALVAQRKEQAVPNRKAGGSIPSGRTT